MSMYKKIGILNIAIFPHAKSPSSSLPLQHGIRELLERLPDRQIGQNFLRASQDGVELVRPLEALNNTSHTALGDTAASPNLNSLIGSLVRAAGGKVLQQGDGAGKHGGLLSVGHVALGEELAME